jgi:hypothetical protein
MSLGYGGMLAMGSSRGRRNPSRIVSSNPSYHLSFGVDIQAKEIKNATVVSTDALSQRNHNYYSV